MKNLDRNLFLAGPVCSLLRSRGLSLSESGSPRGEPEGDLSVEVTVTSSEPPESLRELELTGNIKTEEEV